MGERMHWYGQEPAPVADPLAGLPAPIRSAVQGVVSSIRAAMPGLVSYSVSGGRDPSGSFFAEVVVDATDPVGMLQTASSAILRTVGSGVTIAVPPSTTPGRVRLIFSMGPVMNPSSPSTPRRSAAEVLDSSPGLFSDELGEDLELLGL
jgi:hypothetical protein